MSDGRTQHGLRSGCVYDGGGLRYPGNVGTGFTEAMLADLMERLRPLVRDTSPFGTAVPALAARDARWVEPRLMGEVAFTEWTVDLVLRHPRWRGPSSALHMSISEYDGPVARSSTTSDVFNAIAEAHRREVLDALIEGEKAVGEIVNYLSMSQPQVSKHLRVLSEVGLVRCRAEGRRRLYRLEAARLRPLREWLVKYERAWNDRMDRMDDYLKALQQGERQ